MKKAKVYHLSLACFLLTVLTFCLQINRNSNKLNVLDQVEPNETSIPLEEVESQGASVFTRHDVIAIGRSSFLAVSTDGNVWEVPMDYVSPSTKIDDLENVSSIYSIYDTINSPYASYYAVTFDGYLYTWGDNTYKQLGNSFTSTILQPEMVKGISDVRLVVPCETYSLVITNEGSVYIMGMFVDYSRMYEWLDSSLPIYTDEGVINNADGLEEYDISSMFFESVSNNNNDYCYTFTLPTKMEGLSKVKDINNGAILFYDGSVAVYFNALHPTECDYLGLDQRISEVYSNGRTFFAKAIDGSIFGWGSIGIEDNNQTEISYETPMNLSASEVVYTSRNGYYFISSNGEVYKRGDYRIDDLCDIVYIQDTEYLDGSLFVNSAGKIYAFVTDMSSESYASTKLELPFSVGPLSDLGEITGKSITGGMDARDLSYVYGQ